MGDCRTSSLGLNYPGRPRELLHHSGQGGKSAGEDFQRLLSEQGITCNMSRRGDRWDNAVAESFFSSLKKERIRKRLYKTR